MRKQSLLKRISSLTGEKEKHLFKSLIIFSISCLIGCMCWFFRGHLILTETHETITNEDFPSIVQTMELLRISGLMYEFHSASDYFKNCTRIEKELNVEKGIKNYTCYLYENDEQHTQVIVVANIYYEWIGIIYAGTDDYRNILTDTNILTIPFCTSGTFPNETCQKEYDRPNIMVHEGFYHAVFRDGLYSTLVHTILEKAKKDYPHFSIVTGGHSLGAAASILTAVAFRTMSTQEFLHENLITSINFGCPYIGNTEWYNWVDNTVDRLRIYRYVNEEDVVPRLPPMIGFSHVGHTLQITNSSLVKAYYNHYGNETLGYAGVPFLWETYSLITSPIGAMEHLLASYKSNLESIEKVTTSNTFVKNFEKITPTVPEAINIASTS